MVASYRQQNKMPEWSKYAKLLRRSVLRLVSYLFTLVLLSLMINDLSNVLQKQGFMQLRFFLYMAMIVMRLLLWTVNFSIEDQPLLPMSITAGNSRLKSLSSVCNGGKLSDPDMMQNGHPHREEHGSHPTARELYLQSLDLYTMKSGSSIPKLRSSIAGGSGIKDELLSGADVIITVRTEQGVTLLEKRLKPDTEWHGSRVFHKRFELENFDVDVMESMRLAWDLDNNCTLQVGSFAVFKFTDGVLKRWDLGDDWTPMIYHIRRSHPSLLNIFTGDCATWTIKGLNLQGATLKATTLDESKELRILQHKVDDGMDVLTCEESNLIQKYAPAFQTKVHICASREKEVEKGIVCTLRSKPANIQKAYWISVVDGLTPTISTVIMMASLTFLDIFGWWSHDTHGLKGLCHLFESLQLGLLNMTTGSMHREVSPPLWKTWGVLLYKSGHLLYFIAILSAPAGWLLLRQHISALGGFCATKFSSALDSTVAFVGEKGGQIMGITEGITRTPEPDDSPPPPETTQEAGDRAVENAAVADDTSKNHSSGNENDVVAHHVKALSELNNPELQEAAATALQTIALQDESSKLQIINEAGAVAGLLTSLSDHSSPGLQAAAARALWALASGRNRSSSVRLACEGGVLAGLVASLSKTENLPLQEAAARTFWALASNDDSAIKSNIAKEDGAMARFVKSLSQHNNPGLQEAIAGTLCALATGTDNTVTLKIANEDRAIASLVTSLSEHDNPGLQVASARALWAMASWMDDSIKTSIANQDGALTALVKSLSGHDNPDLQEAAARALLALVCGTDNSIKSRICNEDGALSSLVLPLFCQDKPNLQLAAVLTLECSTYGMDSKRRVRFVDEDGALAGLVVCLSGSNHALQEAALEILWSLARGADDSMKMTIVAQQGALAGLVKAMSEPDLCERAASVLADLSDTTVTGIKRRIAGEDGALAGLVRALLAKNPILQDIVATALKDLYLRLYDIWTTWDTWDTVIKLRNSSDDEVLAAIVKASVVQDVKDLSKIAESNPLSSIEDPSITLTFASLPGALTGLVNAFNIRHKLALQRIAASALVYLSATEDTSIKLRIVQEEGALVGLANVLNVSNETDLLEKAASALTNLSETEDVFIKKRILLVDGVLGGLVRCLPNSSKSNVSSRHRQSVKQKMGHDGGPSSRYEPYYLLFLGHMALKNLPQPPGFKEIESYRLQYFTARALRNLAEAAESREILKSRRDLLAGLSRLLEADLPPQVQNLGAEAMTYVEPTLSKEASLFSEPAHWGRVRAFLAMKLGEDALRDLHRIEKQSDPKEWADRARHNFLR